MGKIDWDQALFAVTAAECGAYGASALFAPKKHQELWFDDGHGDNPEMTRWQGLTLLTLTAIGGVVASNNAMTEEGKKRMLIASGVSWGAVGGMSLYNAAKGKQRKVPSNTCGAASLALAGAMAARFAIKMKKSDGAKKA